MSAFVPNFHDHIDDEWSAYLYDMRKEGLAWSGSALASSVLLLLLYWRFPSTRRTPGWLILRADFFDLFTSACFVCLFLQPLNEKAWTATMAFAVSIFNVSAYSFRAAMYMYLLSIYRNPFQPERHRMWLHMWVLWWTTLMVAWHAFTRVEFLMKMMCGLFFLPFVVFVLQGGFVTLFVQILVCRSKSKIECRQAAQSRSGLGSPNISSLASQRVMTHGNAYFVLFGLRLLIGSCLCVAIWCGSDRRFPWFRDVVMVLAVGGPVFTLFGWVLINDVVHKVFGCGSIRCLCRCFFPPREEAAGPQSSGAEGGDRPTSPLRRRSMSAIVGHNGTQGDMDRFAQEKQGIQEAGFKEELRFELLYNVTKSLGDLAQEALIGDVRRENSRYRTRMGTLGASFTTHTNIEMALRNVDSGDEEDVVPTMSDPESPSDGGVLHGVSEPRGERDRIRKAPSFRSSAAQAAALLDPPRAQTMPRSFRPTEPNMVDSMSSFTEGGADACKVRHYCPQRFQNIRDGFDISRSAYAQSFPNNLTHNMDWRKKLKESVSEGKSGCFFYRVLGGGPEQVSRLIVKQITQGEKQTLMRILPSYESHVKERKGKSFIAYLGCHSMRLSWTMSRKVYFVVMKNFLPASMWLVFDLKGATANRRALTEDHLYKKGEDSNAPKKKYPTLRDWEWLDIAMSVDICVEDRQEIREIIEADARFLGEMNLLDYSLLLGIHRVPQHYAEEQRKEHLAKMRKAGGYVSLDRQKVYFFGIIDVLEAYNCRWRLQNCVLKAAYCLLCWRGSDGISAIPPMEYADRFRTFLDKEVLHCQRLLGIGGGSSLRSVLSEEDVGLDRWAKLWRNRQQGLVRERIEVENEDHLASQQAQANRIAMLENMLAGKTMARLAPGSKEAKGRSGGSLQVAAKRRASVSCPTSPLVSPRGGAGGAGGGLSQVSSRSSLLSPKAKPPGGRASGPVVRVISGATSKSPQRSPRSSGGGASPAAFVAAVASRLSLGLPSAVAPTKSAPAAHAIVDEEAPAAASSPRP